MSKRKNLTVVENEAYLAKRRIAHLRETMTDDEYEQYREKQRAYKRKENMTEEAYQSKLVKKRIENLKKTMTSTEYEEHKAKKRESGRKSDIKLKEEVFLAYGGFRCNCLGCHEHRPQFLQIDHIDGGGCKHRKETGCRTGCHFYRWLKKNNFPPGYRVLCANCNSARGSYGRCPHEDEIVNISYTDDGF